jgi:hypothetical protein
MTECTQSGFEFAALYGREVLAQFDGGDITTDAGGLLLREVDGQLRLIDRLAACFSDHRQPEKIEHSVRELVAQRVYGLALGYEDLNDHDQLRADPLMALLAGKAEPKGTDRRRAQDRGNAGAGKSTLNRLELTPQEADATARYKKIVHQPEALDRLLVDLFLESHAEPPLSAASLCCARGCARPTLMLRRERWRKCNESSHRSGRSGRLRRCRGYRETQLESDPSPRRSESSSRWR